MSIATKIRLMLTNPFHHPIVQLDRKLSSATINALTQGLARSTKEVTKLRGDVASLTRGTKAGVFEEAAEALKNVIEEARDLVRARADETLSEAITRLREELERVRVAHGKTQEELREARQVIATSERIDAAKIIMRERDNAIEAMGTLTAELATMSTRKVDLERQVNQLTAELAKEREELEAVEEASESAPRAEEVGLSSVLTELRVAEAEARKERDAVALDRDAKARQIFALQDVIRNASMAVGLRAGESLEQAIDRLKEGRAA